MRKQRIITTSPYNGGCEAWYNSEQWRLFSTARSEFAFKERMYSKPLSIVCLAFCISSRRRIAVHKKSFAVHKKYYSSCHACTFSPDAEDVCSPFSKPPLPPSMTIRCTNRRPFTQPHAPPAYQCEDADWRMMA